MTATRPSKQRRSAGNRRKFIDNAGHMSRAHIARLRQLSRSSDAAQVAGFLRGLTDADQELADTIAEETVSHMTSGQQQPPDPTLEDLADLSLDVPAREVDVETAHDPVDARDLGNPGDGEE